MSDSIFDQMEKDSAAFKAAPSADDSQKLTALGLELVNIDERLKRYAEVAKELENRKRDIQMREMVDLMDAIGQDRIGLGAQGVDLVLSDYYKAGLPNPDPKDDDYAEKLALRNQGLEWLAENAEGLINTTLEVVLPKGSLSLAKQMLDTIRVVYGIDSSVESRAQHWVKVEEFLAGRNEPGIEATSASIEEGVHWATLTSFVKEYTEKKEEGDEPLPLEALGATIGRIVKIVKRKEKKGK